MIERRPALGKGLSALIPDVPERRASLPEVDIDLLSPNELQPRVQMDDAKLEELAAFDQGQRHHPADSRRRTGTTFASSPASAAGARRSAPACIRCRSSCATSWTVRASSSSSSR